MTFVEAARGMIAAGQGDPYIEDTKYISANGIYVPPDNVRWKEVKVEVPTGGGGWEDDLTFEKMKNAPVYGDIIPVRTFNGHVYDMRIHVYFTQKIDYNKDQLQPSFLNTLSQKADGQDTWSIVDKNFFEPCLYDLSCYSYICILFYDNGVPISGTILGATLPGCYERYMEGYYTEYRYFHYYPFVRERETINPDSLVVTSVTANVTGNPYVTKIQGTYTKHLEEWEPKLTPPDIETTFEGIEKTLDRDSTTMSFNISPDITTGCPFYTGIIRNYNYSYSRIFTDLSPSEYIQKAKEFHGAKNGYPRT